MKRYQVYLNPHSVSILDEVEKVTNITRSKLIRESIDRLAQNLSKILVSKKIHPEKKFSLDNLIGSIDLKTNKTTNYALKDDRLYLDD